MGNNWQAVAPAQATPNFKLRSATSGIFVNCTKLDHPKQLFTFLPGVWAPWCRKLLIDLNNQHSELESAGIKVVAIVSQNYRPVAEFVKNNHIEFEVLSDPYGVINKRFGVFDSTLDEPMKISIPTLFLLDEERNLHYKFIGSHLSDRPTQEHIAKIKQLSITYYKKRNSFWPFSLFKSLKLAQ